MAEKVALGIMARAPSHAGGKTRLTQALGLVDPAALRRAILLDTLAAVRGVAGTSLVLMCTPDGSEGEFESLAGADTPLLPQRGADLGARLHHAFVDLFATGHQAVVLLGSDLPTLPSAHVAQATAALRPPGDRVVLGPAEDGGYYLIGLKTPHPELFQHIPWGSEMVLAATMTAAGPLPVVHTATWYDVDSAADLDRALGTNRSRVGHLRAWADAVGYRGAGAS